MPYPTGAEIRAMLPVEEPPITEVQCQVLIDEWKSLVYEAAGSPVDDAGEPLSVESAKTRRIVRRGARLDAMEELMIISGYIGDAEAITSEREQVDALLASFDAEHTTAAEKSSVKLGSLPWGAVPSSIYPPEPWPW